MFCNCHLIPQSQYLSPRVNAQIESNLRSVLNLCSWAAVVKTGLHHLWTNFEYFIFLAEFSICSGLRMYFIVYSTEKCFISISKCIYIYLLIGYIKRYFCVQLKSSDYFCVTFLVNILNLSALLLLLCTSSSTLAFPLCIPALIFGAIV